MTDEPANDHTLFRIITVFSTLSVLSIGGANTVIPEMHREVVSVHHWVTGSQFADCFAISQAAPGPSMLIVALLGYGAKGWLGGLLATIAMIVPAALLMYFITRVWQNAEESRWRIILQRGMAPITVGLVFASSYLIAHEADHSWKGVLITAAAAWILTATKVNPLIVMTIAGILGAVGWV